MSRYTVIAIIVMLALGLTSIVGTWYCAPQFGIPITILWLLLLAVTIVDLIDHKDYDN